LKEAYPDRINTLLYERVAEEPLKAARSLFRFLELTEPAHFESWLEEGPESSELLLNVEILPLTFLSHPNSVEWLLSF
jgi:hypothetical protein